MHRSRSNTRTYVRCSGRPPGPRRYRRDRGKKRGNDEAACAPPIHGTSETKGNPGRPLPAGGRQRIQTQSFRHGPGAARFSVLLLAYPRPRLNHRISSSRRRRDPETFRRAPMATAGRRGPPPLFFPPTASSSSPSSRRIGATCARARHCRPARPPQCLIIVILTSSRSNP